MHVCMCLGMCVHVCVSTHVCSCLWWWYMYVCTHVSMPVVVVVYMCIHAFGGSILCENSLCPCSCRQSLQIKLRACCWNCFPWPACSDYPYLPSEGGITASHHWSSSILVRSGDSNSSLCTHLTNELSPPHWRVF